MSRGGPSGGGSSFSQGRLHRVLCACSVRLKTPVSLALIDNPHFVVLPATFLELNIYSKREASRISTSLGILNSWQKPSPNTTAPVCNRGGGECVSYPTITMLRTWSPFLHIAFKLIPCDDGGESQLGTIKVLFGVTLACALLGGGGGRSRDTFASIHPTF